MVRYFYLLRYLIGHDLKNTLPPVFLTFICTGLLLLVHDTHPLPVAALLGFCALLGFLQTLNISHCLIEDCDDGTYEALASDGIWQLAYCLVRLVGLFFCFSIPHLASIGLLVYSADIPVVLFPALVLNYLTSLLGVFFLQHILNLTSGLKQRMMVLFLFLPVWLPSFIYLIEATPLEPNLGALLGIMCFQGGMFIVLSRYAFYWRL